MELFNNWFKPFDSAKARSMLKNTGGYLPNSNYSDIDVDKFNKKKKKWDDKNPDGRINLSELDLGGKELSGINFYRVNLRGTEFAGSNLHGSNLRNAILIKADFEGVGTVANMDVTGADLSKAELRGVDLGGVIGLNQATLDGAYYSEDTKFPDDFKHKDKMVRIPTRPIKPFEPPPVKNPAPEPNPQFSLEDASFQIDVNPTSDWVKKVGRGGDKDGGERRSPNT